MILGIQLDQQMPVSIALCHEDIARMQVVMREMHRLVSQTCRQKDYFNTRQNHRQIHFLLGLDEL
jgi:hypothetical protein